MKKLIVITLIIAAIPISLYIAGNYYFSNTRLLELNWGINIPHEFKEIYHVETPIGFHGDGERYTIFKTRGGNFSLFNNFSQSRVSSTEIFVNAILNDLKIPKDKRPPFETGYYWWKSYPKNDGSSLTIIYTLEGDQMYFIEQHL